MLEKILIENPPHHNPYEPPARDDQNVPRLHRSAWRLRIVGLIIAVHHLVEISMVVAPPPVDLTTIANAMKWTTLPVLLSVVWFVPECLGQRRYGLFFVCMTPVFGALVLALFR
jgi:hypothetical protein